MLDIHTNSSTTALDTKGLNLKRPQGGPGVLLVLDIHKKSWERSLC